jgi:hypothetical protein
MRRAGARKVRAYSRESGLTAVRLSQQPGIQVRAVAHWRRVGMGGCRGGCWTPHWVGVGRGGG